MSADEEKARDAEPDRLAGYPSPRETRRLFGHEVAQAEMFDAARSGRMPAAWLLTGPEGIGKATLAYGFARAMFRHPEGAPEGAIGEVADDAVFVQTASLAHPNLLLLRRSWDEKAKRWKQVVSVDEARKLRYFFAGSAGRRGWRVVIVDSADDLNDSAANALLKSIEEPPDKTVFVVVSQAPGRLPVTIRSRCRRLRLFGLAETEMREAVNQALAAADRTSPGPDDEDIAIGVANGSVRRALALLDADGIAVYRALLDIMSGLPRFDVLKAHALADSLSSPANDERFETAFGLLLDLIARLVREAATGEGAQGEEEALAQQLIRPHALARWAELWETLSRAKADADALNLPRRSLLLETFFRLSETARGRAA